MLAFTAVEAGWMTGAVAVAFGAVNLATYLARAYILPNMNGPLKAAARPTATEEQIQAMQNIYPKLHDVGCAVGRLEKAVCGADGCSNRQAILVEHMDRLADSLARTADNQQRTTEVLIELKAKLT